MMGKLFDKVLNCYETTINLTQEITSQVYIPG